MKDFFVSYTGSDVNRALWIAEILEEANYSVTIQAWDFRAGDNFVSKINEALKECKKLIIVLSENYLNSEWCEAEWTSKLAEQIQTNERRIIPIRIERVDLRGLLSPIVYIDIVDKNETEARQEILEGILDEIPRKSNGFLPEYNVKHLEIDLDYYVEAETIVYIKTCKSKALIGGQNSLHSRITWFADETVDIISLTEGVKIERLDLHDTNLNYNVIFDHDIQKDEIIEFRVKAILSNKHKHFDNFFSTEVITPLSNLNINLNIADKKVKKVYTQKLSSSPMNSRTTAAEEHSFNSPFHWHIPNPELHFEYKIFW